MFKRILLTVLAVLAIAGAVGVYFSFVYDEKFEVSQTTVVVDAQDTVETVIRLVDQSGQPVANVKLKVCDENSCSMLTSDEAGVARFVGAPHAWTVEVFALPEGYALASQEAIELPETGGEIEIRLNRA